MSAHITKKEAKKHQRYFDNLLNNFFQVLDSKPKPDKEKIRTEFINAESNWKTYCLKHELGTRASEFFNAKVSYEWERRYVIRTSQTENLTRK